MPSASISISLEDRSFSSSFEVMSPFCSQRWTHAQAETCSLARASERLSFPPGLPCPGNGVQTHVSRNEPVVGLKLGHQLRLRCWFFRYMFLGSLSVLSHKEVIPGRLKIFHSVVFHCRWLDTTLCTFLIHRRAAACVPPPRPELPSQAAAEDLPGSLTFPGWEGGFSEQTWTLCN